MKHPDYYMYPAVFQPDGDMWTVTFPDIDNAFTSADTLEEAIIDAQAVLEDCMYFREKQNDEIPKPSRLNQLPQLMGGVTQMVVADMKRVRSYWDWEMMRRWTHKHEKSCYRGDVMEKYRIMIHWSDDNNSLVVEVPELAGCMADGATPEEALHNISTVIAEWIETAEMLGREIPEPVKRSVYA